MPADIDNPQSDVERDTKKIPLDALMFNGDPVVITADNGDRVLLKAFYIGVANGQKMYKLQMLQQDE